MTARVLLVEDDRSIAAVIGEALREEGHDVTTCAELARRDALLEAGRYDVMLTDVVLADGDGLEGMEAHARTADIRLKKYFPTERFELNAAE